MSIAENSESKSAVPTVEIASPSPADGDKLLPVLDEALSRSGLFRWRLRGDSMLPTLPPGCEVEIVPVGKDVRLGAILVFAAGGTLIAHRLVSRRQGLWITQGDGRLVPDSPLEPARVLGQVRVAYADGRPIWPAARRGAGPWLWVARHHVLRVLRAGWRVLKRAPR